MQISNFSVSFDNQINTSTHLCNLIGDAVASGAMGITLIVGSEYLSELDSLSDYIKTLDVTVSGAIFPEVIYDGFYHLDGAIVIAWYSPIQVKTFLDISNKKSELYTESNLDAKPAEIEGCLIFIDAKAKCLEDALDALYYRNEFDYKFAGGGAGYLKDNDKPCIFSNDGIIEDALQTVSLPFNQDNQMCQGWSILSGPHLVTQASGNRLKALDYAPVKEQYLRFIQESITEDISDIPIEELLSRYPIGIKHYGEEFIIRDPYRYHDGAIELMGNIPEFSNIYILSGKPEILLEYVEQNLTKLLINTNLKKNLSFIFSCAGRRSHMGSVSDTEMFLLAKTLQPTEAVIGTSSLGELVTNEAGLLRLHNMTIVVSRVFT